MMALQLSCVAVLSTLAHARLTAQRGAAADPPPRKIPCDAPVRRAEVKFPDDLVGRAAHNFKASPCPARLAYLAIALARAWPSFLTTNP